MAVPSVTVSFTAADAFYPSNTATRVINLPPAGFETEFVVNSYTTGNQRNPKVATDAAGDSVVVWASQGEDGSGYGIYARLYNAAGVPQGSQFQVNTFTSSNQNLPSVAMDAAGDFVITWQSATEDGGGGYAIYAQAYNASGAPQGSEFMVNSYATGQQADPAVAMDSTGAFVVVWETYDPGVGINAQQYTFSGTGQPVASGSQFIVNTYTTGNQSIPTVAMDSAGDFVVAWQGYDYTQDLGQQSLYAQAYNASGTPQGSEFRVNSSPYVGLNPIQSSIAMDSAGDYVIAWSIYTSYGNSVIDAQRYNAAGVPQGSQFQVASDGDSNRGSPSVGMDTSGDFVITWTDYNELDGSNYGIFAQRYNAAGAPQASEFQVNTFTPGNQNYSSAAMDAAGDLIVVWQGEYEDGSGFNISGKVYPAYNPPVVSSTAVRAQLHGRQRAGECAIGRDDQRYGTSYSDQRHRHHFVRLLQRPRGAGLHDRRQYLRQLQFR